MCVRRQGVEQLGVYRRSNRNGVFGVPSCIGKQHRGEAQPRRGARQGWCWLCSSLQLPSTNDIPPECQTGDIPPECQTSVSVLNAFERIYIPPLRQETNPDVHNNADIQGEAGGRKSNFGGVAGFPNNGCQQIAKPASPSSCCPLRSVVVVLSVIRSDDRITELVQRLTPLPSKTSSSSSRSSSSATSHLNVRPKTRGGTARGL